MQGRRNSRKEWKERKINCAARGGYIRINEGVRIIINPRSLERRGGQIEPPPLDFFGFEFLLLDRLSKALTQLFLVCEHIF